VIGCGSSGSTCGPAGCQRRGFGPDDLRRLAVPPQKRGPRNMSAGRFSRRSRAWCFGGKKKRTAGRRSGTAQYPRPRRDNSRYRGSCSARRDRTRFVFPWSTNYSLVPRSWSSAQPGTPERPSLIGGARVRGQDVAAAPGAPFATKYALRYRPRKDPGSSRTSISTKHGARFQLRGGPHSHPQRSIRRASWAALREADRSLKLHWAWARRIGSATRSCCRSREPDDRDGTAATRGELPTTNHQWAASLGPPGASLVSHDGRVMTASPRRHVARRIWGTLEPEKAGGRRVSSIRTIAVFAR